MAGLGFPDLSVVFDDGRKVHIDLKPRDIARAEADLNFDASAGLSMTAIYTLALAALRRLHKAGQISGVLPETVSDLIDMADIDPIGDDDPEGKDSAPAPPTG